MIFKPHWLQDKQRLYEQTPKASQQEWLRRVFSDVDEHDAPDSEKLV